MKLCEALLPGILCLSPPTSCTPLADDQKHWVIGQTVRTQSGPVSGHAASSAQNVSTYLGIPYAQPPLGNLRFAPPKPYHSHQHIDGSQFGHSCPQANVFGGATPPDTHGKNLTASGRAALDDLLQGYPGSSEDCLTLNVWTKPQFGEQGKAVLLWIYGGGDTIGSSSNPIYDGQYIADQEDVIVVTINYRINIFGFPSAPGYPTNLGLLDQRLAIEWVHSNIRSFGGDPSRITLFGQSAGGGAIDLYSFAYPSSPLVAGLIMQSGTTGLGAFTAETAAESWYTVTSTLGCGDNTTSAATQMKCMRSKDTAAITAAIPLINQPYGSAFFWPTIDEVTVFSDYPARLAAGTFAKLPLLIGSTDYEAGYHRTMGAVFNQYLPDAAWEGFNLYTFTCPAGARANASVAAHQPTYRYRYFGDFPELALTTEPPSRAYHASEVLPLFDTVAAMSNGAEVGGDLVRMGIYLRGAWGMFARDPAEGLTKYGWPRYGPERETLVRLGWKNGVGPNVGAQGPYDVGCP
ncbi:Carboxylic ester hydrolase [Venustampulla echinocandica]|uniref:Carboxylic ester hydrolase n=1 Tax=Venustampulla echinocandica TaxID=2656787 RepID=A0A370T9W8_9HELO|nr:Carboxylic ester hydrolase [Venustampulla echinocandica]RDL30432.1 Carboxylic ester hydrolase [Venustampulla echinocandica]